MNDKKRMSGLTKLSSFTQPMSTSQPTSVSSQPSAALPAVQEVGSVKATPSQKLVTVNIKILKTQHEWLNDVARQVRDNNDEPVAASDRVYPQHLIQVAIELLKSSNVDWENVKNVAELRHTLNLLDL